MITYVKAYQRVNAKKHGTLKNVDVTIHAIVFIYQVSCQCHPLYTQYHVSIMLETLPIDKDAIYGVCMLVYPFASCI